MAWPFSACPPSQEPTLGPVDYHEHGASRAHAAAAALRDRSRPLAAARGLAAAATLVAGFGALAFGWPGWAWLLPLGAFVVALALDQRQQARRRHELRRAAHHEDALRRIGGGWPGHGPDGFGFLPDEHAFSTQLDLFGEGSLFQRLCRARTRGGRERLAAWLVDGAAAPELRARQAAARSQLDAAELRLAWALAGPDRIGRLQPAVLEHWVERPPLRGLRAWRLVALGLGVGLGAAVALAFAGVLSWGWAGLGVIALVAQYYMLGRSLEEGRARLVSPAAELAVLGPVLEVFESKLDGAGDPWLGRRLASLHGDRWPSASLASLRRTLDWLDSTRNLFFAPIALVLNLPAQLALAAEAWRVDQREALPAWLDALADLEALLSLAAFAHEEGEGACVPELVEGASFHATGLAHPLLPADTVVRNDLSLDREHPLLVVSGSNMSGKSTLLRSVGCAVVLARAGAVVRARSLQLGELDPGACIVVQDDLLGGASRFWAEISQLRRVVDLAAGSRPLLFLVDEMLSGTNSRDRREGARLVLQRLLDAGALGLVTTHDLALTELAQDLAPPSRNAHFEDQVQDGELRFDYRLRPGVAERTNAMELMRAVGLLPPGQA